MCGQTHASSLTNTAPHERNVPRRQPLSAELELFAFSGIMLAEFFVLPNTPCFGRRSPWLGPSLVLLRPMALAPRICSSSPHFLHSAPGSAIARRPWQETERATRGAGREPSTSPGSSPANPRASPNEFSTFLLHLHFDQALMAMSQSCGATVQARWKGNPALGDEIRLAGIAGPITPPRNPGVFDLRAYLARQDVFDGIFVRYPEDGSILRDRLAAIQSPAAAAVAHAWMRTTPGSGRLEDSPDVDGLDQRHGARFAPRSA